MVQILELDLAIDLGTANTLIYRKHKGLVFNEPSVVALEKDLDGSQHALHGEEAKNLLGRVSDQVTVLRPVRSGVVADFEVTALMLRYFVQKALPRHLRLLRPRMVVGVPADASAIERRATEEAALLVASEVWLIDEALAAAIGAGLPVETRKGSMVVDIGGGTTDIAVVSSNRVVCSRSVKIGGDAMDGVLTDFLKNKRGIRIGESTAELIKKTIGTAHPHYDDQEMKVSGQEVNTGLPTAITVTSAEVREALSPMIYIIAATIRQALEKSPPDLMGDILMNGITLTGGGALLKGLDRKLSDEIGVPVVVANNALTAVVEGAGRWLDQRKKFPRSKGGPLIR